MKQFTSKQDGWGSDVDVQEAQSLDTYLGGIDVDFSDKINAKTKNRYNEGKEKVLETPSGTSGDGQISSNRLLNDLERAMKRQSEYNKLFHVD